MSAEALRRAAAVMRERAKAAPAGPWRPTAGAVWANGEHQEFPIAKGTFWPEHIASWNPTVALAVADWLEQTADYAEVEGLAVLPDGAPLAVAYAYLGEER